MVEAYCQPGTGLLEQAAGAETRMDIAVDDGIGVLKNDLGTVGEHELHLGALRTYELGIILYVIDTGEFVQVDPEKFTVAIEREHIGIRVHPGLVEAVKAHKRITHLVGGVRKHQYYFAATLGDTLKADGETVAAQDGENHAHGSASRAGPDVFCNVVDGSIITLRPCNHRLGDGNDVAVADFKFFFT